MFGKGKIFIRSSALGMGVAIGLFACTKNTPNPEIPSRPVASATSTQAPLRNAGEDQEHNGVTESEVPFDGGRPEAFAFPSPSPQALGIPESGEGAQQNIQHKDIYTELIGQSLTCEDTQL